MGGANVTQGITGVTQYLITITLIGLDPHPSLEGCEAGMVLLCFTESKPAVCYIVNLGGRPQDRRGRAGATIPL